MSSIPYAMRPGAAQAASGVQAKGLALSHLLGLVIASEFVVSSAAGHRIPFVDLPLFTNWLDFPVRLLAAWLLLDRNWRLGRLRIQFFDVLILGYVGIVGIAFPFTALDPSVAPALEDYRGFAGDMLRYYLVYLLVREAHNRVGFRSQIMIGWVMVGLSYSALLAVLQFLDIGGIRGWSIGFYQQTVGARSGESWRAAGAANHWNGFASSMVLAFVISLAPLNYRRMRWYECIVVGIFVLGLLVSTSRGGYVTLAVTAAALGIFYVSTGRGRTGAWLLSAVGVAVIAFLTAALVFELPRFKDLVSPPKVRSADYFSLDYRADVARRLTERGMDRPIAGTGPSNRLWHNERLFSKNAASVMGPTDVSYAQIFAEFGLLGLAYLGFLVYGLVRTISPRRFIHPYSGAMFGAGVAFAVQSVVENLFRSQIMILVALVAGLGASRVLVKANRFGDRRIVPAEPEGSVLRG